MSETSKPARAQKPPPGPRQIAGAQALLFAEKLWPALLPSAGVIALFCLISLFDLWPALPWALHYAVLGLLAGMLVYFLVRDLKDLTWPEREEALARLETDGRVPHAPLQSLEDTPFGNEEDNPLWRAHQARMKKLAARTKLRGGHATMDSRDPYALRYATVLLLALGFLTARGDIAPRFWQALSPQMDRNSPVIVDLWIDPPAYTGKAPVVLAQSEELVSGTREQINVPAGSILHARVAARGEGWLDRWAPGRARLDIVTSSSREQADFSHTDSSLIAETTLTENHALTFRVAGRTASWPVLVIQDRPPEIVFRDVPETTDNNRIRFVVEIQDDYGVTTTDAVLMIDPDQERPLDAPVFDTESLTEQEMIPVSGITGSFGPRSAELDLTEHRWAGLSVRLRLTATDGAGQTGETLTETVILPERAFFNPLAKAVIHERRNLAVASEDWRKTGRAFDALTFAPDRFFDQSTDYLLLRTAYHGVMSDKGENTRTTVEELWPLALQLEDQALELARRALEAAARELREALERGAPEAEVERLVENLRTAMNNYIHALAESGQANADGTMTAEELGASDLDDILESINDLSQSGANNAARQLLSELEQMLQNLQISSGASGQAQGQAGGEGQPGDEGQGQGAGSGAMGAAGDMISDQRDLADDTFAAGQGNGSAEGMEAPRSVGELQAEQQGLADQLEKMIDELKAGGEERAPGEDAISAFEEALEKMAEAADALGSANTGAAGTLQEEALEALRNGADGLEEAFLEEQAEREGNGEEGELNSGNAAANNNGAPSLDPLGRPYGSTLGPELGIPDLSDPEKARELIMKLRERLAQPGLNDQEIDYLERLLERF